MKELTERVIRKYSRKSLKRQRIQKWENLVLSGIKMCYTTITYKGRVKTRRNRIGAKLFWIYFVVLTLESCKHFI